MVDVILSLVLTKLTFLVNSDRYEERFYKL